MYAVWMMGLTKNAERRFVFLLQCDLGQPEMPQIDSRYSLVAPMPL